MSKTLVEIALPVLNEEAVLEENVKKILHFVQDSALDDYEIKLVIADNGSTDKTPDIGAALAQRFPHQVRYERIPRKGVGLALKTVWTASPAAIVGYMDIDLATDLKHLKTALDAVAAGGYDVATGSRLQKSSQVVGRKFIRTLTSRTLALMLRTYFRIRFTDGMCGFKFVKQPLVQKFIDFGAVSDGWFFATEMLTVAEWSGHRIYDFPVEWTDDPASKVKIVKLALEYMRAMYVLKQKKPAILKQRKAG